MLQAQHMRHVLHWQDGQYIEYSECAGGAVAAAEGGECEAGRDVARVVPEEA
jgi:hypothetical protein